MQAAVEFFAGFNPAKGGKDFSALVTVKKAVGRFVLKEFSGKGDEKLEDKDMDEIAEKVAVKVGKKIRYYGEIED
jgi:hypothetical protein